MIKLKQQMNERKDTKETEIENAVSKVGYDMNNSSSSEILPQGAIIVYRNDNFRLLFIRKKENGTWIFLRKEYI